MLGAAIHRDTEHASGESGGVFDLIGGLPLHPLAIHAAVVLVPLSAAGVVLYVVIPRWREALRWPLLVTSTVAAAATLLGYLSGEPLQDRLGLGESRAVQRHAELGEQSLIVVLVWWVVVVLLLGRWWPRGNDRPALTRALLIVAVVVSLMATASVIATGHSGASSVWGPRVATS